MLRSDLCDFSDAYIVVKGDIILKKATARDFVDIRNKFLKATHQLLVAFNLLTIRSLTMQKI